MGDTVLVSPMPSLRKLLESNMQARETKHTEQVHLNRVRQH